MKNNWKQRVNSDWTIVLDYIVRMFGKDTVLKHLDASRNEELADLRNDILTEKEDIVIQFQSSIAKIIVQIDKIEKRQTEASDTWLEFAASQVKTEEIINNRIGALELKLTHILLTPPE